MLSSSVNDTVTSAFASVLPASAATGVVLPSSVIVGCVGAVVSIVTASVWLEVLPAASAASTVTLSGEAPARTGVFVPSDVVRSTDQSPLPFAVVV